MKRKKVLAMVLAFLLLLTPIGVFAEGNTWSPIDEKKELNFFTDRVDGAKLLEQLRGKFDWKNPIRVPDLSEFSKEDTVVMIVELSGASGLETANRRGVAYEMMSDAEALERETLVEQSALLDRLTEAGVNYTVKEQYTAVLNAVAIELKVEDLEKVKSVQGVEEVYFSNSFYAPKTEKSRMYFTHDMIYDETAWKMGFKGEGSVVAVLDTGIDWLHRDFQTLTNPAAAKLNEKKVETLIRENELKGRYFSPKVPYGYNYFDHNQDVKDSAPDASMHGQHVSGTVGANGEIKGVAPEVQILGMKVFGNDPLVSTTSDHVYVKAFDDAIKLGADVINMSLGSPAGFNDPKSATGKAITNAVENGIVFAISAGNEGSSNHDDQLGVYDPQDPDIAMLGSPSAFTDSTSVASINNHIILGSYLTVDGREMVYQEVQGRPFELRGIHEYVFCGLGQEADFEGKDVKGKVALIQRGVVSFETKLVNAKKNGAIAGIVFNNQPGLFGMAVGAADLPAISMDLSDGEFMVSKIEEGKNQVLVEGKTKSYKSPTGNLMSGFSSWGPSPTLDLKPEITAPGGDIYSTMNDDQYEYMSGTSMAAPHVAGGYAVINQYIREQLPNFKYNKVTTSEKRGLRDIPNRSFIVEKESFSEEIVSTSKAYLLYDAMKNGKLIYKSSKGQYFDKTGEIEYIMPSEMVYYNAHGEKFIVDPRASESEGKISNEPLTKGDTTRLAKVLLMNTAVPVLDQEGELVSPRKQGAGLMNIGAAVKTPAVLLDARSNEPKVELRNIEDTEFDMNLRVVNASDEALEYAVDVSALRDALTLDKDGNLKSYALSMKLDAKIDAPEKVVVPANGFTDFRVSVDFTESMNYRNMYVEGFVQLKSEDHPMLTIPYMGFYGHYTEPKAMFPWSILGEGDTKEILENNPFTYGAWIEGGENVVYGEGVVAKVTPVNSPVAAMGIIPNFSRAQLYYALRRNVGELQYRLLDASGEKEIGLMKAQGLTRKNYRKRPHIVGPSFNGSINGYSVPDGNYMYEVRVKSVMPNADWESKMAPVLIDSKGPKVSAKVENRKLILDIEDETTTVLGGIVASYNGAADFYASEEKDDFGRPIGTKTLHHEIDLEPFLINGEFGAEVMFFDQLGNTTMLLFNYGVEDQQPNIYFLSPQAFETYNADATGVVVKFAVFDTKFQPKATINGEEITQVIFDESATIKKGQEVIRQGGAFIFTHEVPISALKQGYNDLIVKVVTSDEKYERSLARTIFVDSAAPEMTLEVLERKSGDTTAQIKVTAKDAVSPWATLFVNGSQVHYFDHSTFDDRLVGFEDTVTVTVELEEGMNEFEFRLIDDFSNEVIETIRILK